MITDLAASGVPLHAADTPAWVEPELALLAAWTPEEGDGSRRSVTDLRREEHSVRLRRHGLRSRAGAAAEPVAALPKVSVVMSSMRPYLLLRHSTRSPGSGGWRSRSCWACTASPPSTRRYGGRCGSSTCRSPWSRPARKIPFGEVLNRAASRASGDHITKWDDDDWYGPEHLADLLLARSHTGADIVGTTAEFFYLEPLNATIRRTDYTSEIWSEHVAGGTILLDLAALPGARRVPRAARRGGRRVPEGRARRGGAHLPDPRPRLHAATLGEHRAHLAALTRPFPARRVEPVARFPPESDSGKTMTARITGNDYRSLTPPEIGAWTPSLRVSVVVPAYGGQDKLDLVLAGLAGQTYPAALTEIIVVDNGSLPPLRLPDLRPAGTRLIVCPVPGRAHARNAGLLAATGDVIHWLDSDVVLDRRSVEAHMRWHHAAPYLVVIGYLRFTPAELPAPGVVAAADDLAKIFEPAEPHAWLVDLSSGPAASSTTRTAPSACTWAAPPRSTPRCSPRRGRWTPT